MAAKAATAKKQKKDADQDRRLDQVLISTGVISEEQVEDAKIKAIGSRRPFQDVLIEMAYCTDLDVCNALSQILETEPVTISTEEINSELTELVPFGITQRWGLMPLKQEEDILTVAMSNPMDLGAIDELAVYTGMKIRPVLARKSDITKAIETVFHTDEALYDMMKNVIADEDIEVEAAEHEEKEEVEDLRTQSEQAPIVKLTGMIINDAIKMEASDIHIEPQEKQVILRYRVDGLLKIIMDIPKNFQASLISRLKIMAELDIAERRIPQDGRMRVTAAGQVTDLRVSTLPTYFGEKVVMRILDTSQSTVPLDVIGFSAQDLELYETFLMRPQGMVLVTGPTGSGKTSTLYASLNRLKDETINIVTVEDPVEFQVPGLNQVQVNAKAGLTFAAALRSILRQDPDVVLLGEIRDKETAQIACQAALTGHVVFSTLHTNDAASAVTRLIDVGLEPYLIASTLVGTLAQRLVRKICPDCKEEDPEPDQRIIDLVAGMLTEVKDLKFFKGKGCENCHYTGYKGRTAIMEILEVNEEIQELISQGSSQVVIQKAARRNGMKNLMEAALAKTLAGLTTLEEAIRVAFISKEPLIPCLNCGQSIRKDFKLCPYCSYVMVRNCTFCGQQLDLAWDACPFCGRDQPAPAKPTKKAAVSATKKPTEKAPTVPTAEDFPEMHAAEKEEKERKQRVLVVDDEEFMRELVAEAFSEENAELVMAEDGEEALAKAYQTTPDLIITDLDMPKMDGVTLCKKLRSKLQTASIPIIILTAQTDMEQKIAGIEAGADDYILKPFKPDKLVSRAKMLIERRRGG